MLPPRGLRVIDGPAVGPVGRGGNPRHCGDAKEWQSLRLPASLAGPGACSILAR